MPRKSGKRELIGEQSSWDRVLYGPIHGVYLRVPADVEVPGSQRSFPNCPLGMMVSPVTSNNAYTRNNFTAKLKLSGENVGYRPEFSLKPFSEQDPLVRNPNAPKPGGDSEQMISFPGFISRYWFSSSVGRCSSRRRLPIRGSTSQGIPHPANSQRQRSHTGDPIDRIARRPEFLEGLNNFRPQSPVYCTS